MTEARFEYRCRRCGRVKATLCSSETFADKILTMVSIGQESSVEMHDVHFCKDGGRGLSDLLGYRVVETEIETEEES